MKSSKSGNFHTSMASFCRSWISLPGFRSLLLTVKNSRLFSVEFAHTEINAHYEVKAATAGVEFCQAFIPLLCILFFL